MKLNQKGYMLVEIIVAFSLAMAISFYLINLTNKFKETNEDIYESTIYMKEKIAVTKNIMNDLENSIITDYQACEGNCILLTTNNGDKKKLEANKDGSTGVKIIYGKVDNSNNYMSNDVSYYVKELDKSLVVGNIVTDTSNADYFSINIPITSIYNDEHYDIRLFGQKVSYMVEERDISLAGLKWNNGDVVENPINDFYSIAPAPNHQKILVSVSVKAETKYKITFDYQITDSYTGNIEVLLDDEEVNNATSPYLPNDSTTNGKYEGIFNYSGNTDKNISLGFLFRETSSTTLKVKNFKLVTMN